MGETLGAERRSRLSTLAIFKLYKNVLLDKVALFYILQQGAMSIILFVYISTSPYIFQNIYGLNAISFSGIFALNAAGIGVGAMLSSKFRRRRTAVVFSGVGAFAVALVEAFVVCGGADVVVVESLLFIMMCLFGVAAPAAAASAPAAPPAVPVDAQITGVDVLDLEPATQALWKENIYAENAMGCTGPVIRVQASHKERAVAILQREGFLAPSEGE